MKNVFAALLLAALLAGCSVATTADLARELPPSEQVTIYVPDSFVAAVDGEKMGTFLPGDPTIVQRITVEPGTRVYDARLAVPDGMLILEWEFRFRFHGQPGHTYYLWYGRKGQENPRIYGRDLGPGVPLESLPVSPAFALRSGAELHEERRIRLELRERGTPIFIELLPPE